jgi:GNAT superfamily N-acetyltransferase
MAEFMAAWQPGMTLPVGFLELPAQVYADDPFWMAEDSAAVSAQFSPGNSWFDDGDAWIGVIPGQARLAGFFRNQQIDGEPAAFFGYWEGINEPAAHHRLFDALREWARQRGAKRIYGPINFTTFNAYRLRIDGFESGAFPGEPWNPPYYASLLEQCGFDIRYRYLSTFNDTASVIDSIKADYLRVKPQLEKAVCLDTMTPDFWMGNLDELYGFVDQVFGGNFAYTPISRNSFVAACGKPFADRFCPRTSVLARTHDGRIAGFFLVFPDYSPLLRQSSGTPVRPADITWEQHYPHLPRPRLGLAKTGGVHPDFRSLGLFTAMGCELSLRAEGIYDTLAGTLVREDNPSRQFALRHGSGQRHSYALYQAAP